MSYTILRFKKLKGGAVAGCERHNERKKEAYKSNPDIDIERSRNNYHIIQPPQYTYLKKVKQLIKDTGCKTRKDSVMLVETLITASPDFMSKLDTAEQKEYFERATNFMIDKIGKDKIISAVVHLDESNPHMHLVFCPINKENKLSAKSLLGNQKTLSEWQTEYFECMHERWNELDRGKSSMETKRKHIPTWLFKLSTTLDSRYEEIVSLLNNSNIFNAGKNRERVIEILQSFLPQKKRFETTLLNLKPYIESLKDQINTEQVKNGNLQEYCLNLKSDLDDEKSKNYKTLNQMQKQVDKYEKIIKQIPDDVLKEIENKNRNKSQRAR